MKYLLYRNSVLAKLTPRTIYIGTETNKSVKFSPSALNHLHVLKIYIQDSLNFLHIVAERVMDVKHFKFNK
jgi:hypothetical protein